MKKILVIEDECTLRESIVQLLEAQNFRAIAAEDGQVGVQIAQEQLPDMILCDVLMPGLDGYGVLSQLRQNPATALTPFIFLTSMAAKESFRRGMQLGADDYLTKPCSLEELLGAIRSRFAKQATLINHTQQQLNSLCSSITRAFPHEFRTPLNGVLGLTEVLIDDYEAIDRHDLLDIVQGVHDSAARLHHLSQNFLLYAELEAALHNPGLGDRYQAGRTNEPHELINQTSRALVQASERDADFHLSVQDLRPEDLHLQTLCVCMAAPYLKKIIEELLSNVCKFSEPGTPIHLSATVQSTGYTLTLTDQGRGMTADQVASLGPYRQIDRPVYEQQGTGLGVAIVKCLVELHQGQFHLHSLLGQGTTIQVTLPIQAMVPPEE